MRRMYSEKQLKELISEMSGDILEVRNVKQLNDEQCNGLKVGDIVAKKTGKQYHCYIVTYKQDKHGLCLSYFDASVVETQSYDYTAGHWVYNSEDKTELGGSGLPDVNGADNGSVLEVIDGQWAKGRKKVNVIDAPASTTLTDEELNLFKEGVFINGTFAGLNNPVIFPAKPYSDTLLVGIVCGGGSAAKQYFYYYKIENKVFSLDNAIICFEYFQLTLSKVSELNGKAVPNYPSNTGTFTLKCVDGVLTWVQDQ